MVLGRIPGGLKTRLVVAHGNSKCLRYINQISLPEAVPFIQRQPHQVTLQQDNARPHSKSGLKSDLELFSNSVIFKMTPEICLHHFLLKLSI